MNRADATGQRLLITGGSSYLGQHLVPLAKDAYQVCYTFFSHDPLQLSGGVHLDVHDRTAVMELVTTLRPHAIIHTAGSNRSPDMTAVIEAGATHMVTAAAMCDARLIHLSTDVVFDGRSAPYSEVDTPTPIHDYGRAKTKAETAVAQYDNHVIIRTSLLYGVMLMDRGMEWVVAALQSGEPVTLFNNQYRNPIAVSTLSDACLELLAHDYCGILHIAGDQIMKRSDFTLRLLDWWGITKRHNLRVAPDQSGRWPLNCCLSVDLAKSILQTPLLGVDAQLKQLTASPTSSKTV